MSNFTFLKTIIKLYFFSCIALREDLFTRLFARNTVLRCYSEVDIFQC